MMTLDLLNAPMMLNLNLNEIRILVTCMRAIEYQGEEDDEPYLDEEGSALKARLEKIYSQKLRELQKADEAV